MNGRDHGLAFVASSAFLGWLLSDLVHLLLFWPVLGGVDMLLHHATFACLTCLGVGYRMCPLVVGWLLLGELSSMPLNMRWILINTGRGDSRALARTNFAFAGSFFVVRVVVFWFSLAHALRVERPLLLSLGAPPWSVNTLCAFLSAGALLNAFWFARIVQIARRPTPSADKAHGQRRPSAQPLTQRGADDALVRSKSD